MKCKFKIVGGKFHTWYIIQFAYSDSRRIKNAVHLGAGHNLHVLSQGESRMISSRAKVVISLKIKEIFFIYF